MSIEKKDASGRIVLEESGWQFPKLIVEVDDVGMKLFHTGLVPSIWPIDGRDIEQNEIARASVIELVKV